MSEFGLMLPEKAVNEFGLKLPPTTKLGADGKGEKAFIIAQSKVRVIFGVLAVLAVLSVGLYRTNSTNTAEFKAKIENEHTMEEHQRLSKLEAEATLAEMSAKMSQQTQMSKEEESDLKIMASHISYVQQQMHISILQSIDDESLTVADIKQQVDKQFTNMQNEIDTILHDHLVVVEGANTKSNAEMDRIEQEVQAQLKAQQLYDNEKVVNKNLNPSSTTTIDENKQIEAHINSIFNHVYGLAEKMGDTDIDGLLSADTVKEWEQILTDAETGKLAYPDAVAKMEEIIVKAPAALKLAEATGALELVEEDGGSKGVTEVSNFRSLLKHVRWLPQYAAVLEEFSAWKNGDRTVQEVLVWTEQKIASKEIDGTWLNEAYKKAHTQTQTAQTIPSTAQKPAATAPVAGAAAAAAAAAAATAAAKATPSPVSTATSITATIGASAAAAAAGQRTSV
jgi:hypothetical protein